MTGIHVGYAFIPVVASIILMVHHVAITDASRWSKLVVAVVVIASLAIWRFAPQWLVLATILQVATSVYMLVYLKWHGYEGH
jgi:hypothetical protein